MRKEIRFCDICGTSHTGSGPGRTVAPCIANGYGDVLRYDDVCEPCWKRACKDLREWASNLAKDREHVIATTHGHDGPPKEVVDA